MAETVIIKEHPSKPIDVLPIQDICSGPHLEEFISYMRSTMGLSASSASKLRNTTCDILSHCNPHDAVNNIDATHLAVGYVQSGKTMSFTSLIELALDNKYKVIIIFAGITTSLLKQTCDRLRKDLKCGNHLNNKFFKIHKNPTVDDLPSIANDLQRRDSILVIPVLKHYDRIAKLAELFESQQIRDILKGETAIIIDDEADQASLNNYGRKNSSLDDSTRWNYSSTFASIMRLRLALDGNSYIQYTATPQANILISQIDILSPKSHTLLYPGEGYCGGKQFFGVNEYDALYNGKLIKRIPEDQVFNRRVNPLDEIPESLETAIMLHIWAVTIVIRWYKVSGIGQLSMMIHADETLDWNRKFYEWVNELILQWMNIFNQGSTIEKDLLSSKFRIALNEASRLYDDVPSYDELETLLIDTINDTRVYRITGDSNDMEDLDWDSYTSNILIGAQMLNRGFTVEKLTTTYMPRYSTSITNADTIEQRCRFYGYKMKYIKSCRVFLPEITIVNYKDYVKSEEELRFAMESTNSMQELGHKILTSPTMRPTRNSVLPANIVREKMKGMHEFSSYEKSSVMEHNKTLAESFYKHYDRWEAFSCKMYTPLDYTGIRLHNGIRVSPDEAIKFLKEYIFTDANEKRYIGDTIRYIYYLSNLNENPIKDVQFIMMASGLKKQRTLGVDNKLTSNLFTGPSSSDDPTNYPGDRAIHAEDTITIQLHRVYLENKDLETISIAAYFPEKLAVTYTSTEN